MADDGRIVGRTNNFSVITALGPIGIEGYVLLCTNEHYDGVGGMPAEFEEELEVLLGRTKNVLRYAYDSPIAVFEHGPRLGRHRGGSCIGHAHLHVLPTKANLVNFVEEGGFKMEEIKGFSMPREIYRQGDFSYLFLEQNGKRHVCAVGNLPSQYLRRAIAIGEGREERWDWAAYPDYEVMEKTFNRLRGKFDNGRL